MQMKDTGRQPHILSGDNGWVVLLQLDSSVIEHAHPYEQALIKVGGPDREILVGDDKRLLTDDNFIVVDPWVPHGGMPAITSEPTHMLAINLDTLCGRNSPARRFIAPRKTSLGNHTITRELRQQADHLCHSILRGHATYEEVRAIIHALGLLEHARGAPADSRDIPDYRIRRIVSNIHSDPTLVRDIDTCAEMAGLSRPHFFHLFRENTGLSPRLFANSIRLETAINWLASPSVPIRSIGEALGFSAPGHFTRFFQRHIGVTPRAFRRALMQ